MLIMYNNIPNNIYNIFFLFIYFFFLYSAEQKLHLHTQIKRKILRHGQKHKHTKDRTKQHISAQTSARHTVISPEV